MKLVTAREYYEALLRGAPLAKKRIVIHAMTIWWGPQTEQLVPLLIEAVQRGVEVRIVGDVYSKFQTHLPRFSRAKTPSWGHIQAVTNALQKGGVHITYVGKLGFNPFKNRCHSKITLIDDLIYSFGGVNFADDSFENHDYMIELRDAALAGRLYRLIREIEKDSGMPLPDLKEPLDKTTTMLFDGGAPGKSVIYETACEVVASAKKVYYVSQMCPSGKLAKHITATDNECYFIHAYQAEVPANVALIVDKFRYQITNRYRGKTYIHAKFILTEGQDGSRHVVTGSNNFSWRGVAYGTKEIAVHSTDPKLWQSLYDFMRKEIAV